MEWERNTVSLPVRVLFRKRRIFLPDKWNSWSNAREWDNAERMRWFSRTRDTSVLSFSHSDLDDSSTRLQKRITGTKISHRPVRRYARVHIPRSDMVRYSVQALRCAGYNLCACVCTHAHVCAHPLILSLLLPLPVFFSFSARFFLIPERPQKSELKRTTQYTRLAFIPGRDKFYREARKHEKCPTSRFKKGVRGARCIFHARCIYVTMRLEWVINNTVWWIKSISRCYVVESWFWIHLESDRSICYK